ncbi:transposase [Streptomyces lavendulae]|uniref:transposase n=1 Tax=Streptomyces lavendulae TaxID=1914 RepID=UPI0033196A73
MVDWRRLYGLRSGAEGGIEEFVDGHHGRRCRYRGLAKTHVQHVLTALAINVERLSLSWPWARRARIPIRRARLRRRWRRPKRR